MKAQKSGVKKNETKAATKVEVKPAPKMKTVKFSPGADPQYTVDGLKTTERPTTVLKAIIASSKGGKAEIKCKDEAAKTSIKTWIAENPDRVTAYAKQVGTKVPVFAIL